MGYINYNVNPQGKNTIDCTVRALSTLLDKQWDEVYVQLCVLGYRMADMPSSKAVVHEYLRRRGFSRAVIPDTCLFCYSVKEFCRDHSEGEFLLATDTHVIPVINGDYVDTWDSGDEIPLFYWRRK